MNERTCLNCRHFDPNDTSLPVCVLHRKYMHDQWVCADFAIDAKGGDEDARKEDAAS